MRFTPLPRLASGFSWTINAWKRSFWEHYMRELGAAAQSGPLTSEAIGQIASRFDFQKR